MDKTNDAHPDIAYMLVFNCIPLQERLCLRVICHRWKAIIESDCAQMTTLRVFGTAGHLKSYFKRTRDRESKPPLTANDRPVHDPNRFNTIALKRPGFDKYDLNFLPLLFPAVSNLVLTWKYGKQIKYLLGKSKKQPENEQKNLNLNDAFEPDIFGLLTVWAPKLRKLYLITMTYDFKSTQLWMPKTYLNKTLTTAFWKCLTLMSSLENLTFRGINIKTAPKSLILHSLKSLSYYHVDQDAGHVFLITSPNRLHRLAPNLGYLLVANGVLEDIWDWRVPSTVTTLAFNDIDPPKNDPVVCPSITHLEVEHPGPEYFIYVKDMIHHLPRKFPNLTSLKVFEKYDFTYWLSVIGRDIDSVGYLSAIARKPATPLDVIKELTIVGFAHNLILYQELDYDASFRGIGATFKGLTTLFLTIPPNTETIHEEWYGRIMEYRDRYLPKVELKFSLACFMCLREYDRWRAYKYAPEYEASISENCYFTPGCVFSGTAAETN